MAVDTTQTTTGLFQTLFEQIFRWEQAKSNPLRDETQQGEMFVD